MLTQTHSPVATYWALAIWALCMLDFLTLARCGSSVLALMASGPNDTKRPYWMIQSLFWGSMKLLCLGAIGVALFYGRSIPSIALLLGLGTLLVVPLFGGFWWSRKEFLTHA
jgi:hypothetical protein